MKEVNSAMFMLMNTKTVNNNYNEVPTSPRSPRSDYDAKDTTIVSNEIAKVYTFENGRESRFYFDLMKFVKLCYLLFSISGIFLAALQYELEFRKTPYSNPRGLLYINFIATLILIFMTVVKHRLNLIFRVKSQEEPANATIWKSPYFSSMMLECVVNLMHPTPFLYEVDFDYVTAYDYYPTHYDVNDFFSLLILLRLFYIFKSWTLFTFWNSNRARRVCHMYDAEPGVIFAIKSVMKSSPLKLVFSIYIFTIPFFAYCLRIAERPVSLIDTGTIWSYASYFDAMWNVIITLSTVGYGDMYPRTGIGRFFAFCLCLWGSFIISLMVVAITRFIEMSYIEEKAYGLLKRLQLKQRMKASAASVVTKIIKIKLDYKNKRPKNVGMINSLRKDLSQLKKKSRVYRSLGLSEIGFETLYRKYVYMRDDVGNMISQTNDLILINMMIMKALGMDHHFAQRKGLKEFKEFRDIVDRKLKDNSIKNFQSLLRVEEADEISEASIEAKLNE